LLNSYSKTMIICALGLIISRNQEGIRDKVNNQVHAIENSLKIVCIKIVCNIICNYLNQRLTNAESTSLCCQILSAKQISCSAMEIHEDQRSSLFYRFERAIHKFYVGDYTKDELIIRLIAILLSAL
jgi:hypothetical protein